MDKKDLLKVKSSLRGIVIYECPVLSTVLGKLSCEIP
jgi:hypothetical protein